MVFPFERFLDAFDAIRSRRAIGKNRGGNEILRFAARFRD
jgi:hypothetical protein